MNDFKSFDHLAVLNATSHAVLDPVKGFFVVAMIFSIGILFGLPGLLMGLVSYTTYHGFVRTSSVLYRTIPLVTQASVLFFGGLAFLVSIDIEHLPLLFIIIPAAIGVMRTTLTPKMVKVEEPFDHATAALISWLDYDDKRWALLRVALKTLDNGGVKDRLRFTVRNILNQEIDFKHKNAILLLEAHAIFLESIDWDRIINLLETKP